MIYFHQPHYKTNMYCVNVALCTRALKILFNVSRVVLSYMIGKKMIFVGKAFET